MIDTHELIKAYNEGASMRQLGLKYNVSPQTIKAILKNNNVYIRSRNEQNKFNPQNQRKYNINDYYFSQQGKNMAYLLGFFAADGCVYAKDNGIKLALASVDREFLEQINKELDSTYPIRDYETKDGYKNSELRWTSNQIKKDFADYNIIPNKTYSYTFPTKLKKEYYKDFIRGYFDGDGSVSTAGAGNLRWQLCSHEKNILEKVIDYFETQGIPKVKIYKCKDKELFYIQYSTQSTLKIFNVLYYDDCFCLPRKYNKYKALIETKL